MPVAEQKTEAIKYWKITADGIGSIGMFNQCSLPSMSLQASEFKVWDEQGKPNPLPTGVQASFGDVTLGRGVDTADRALEVDLEDRPEGLRPATRSRRSR